MLSRVANSIYWMCRYIERAENVARFISVNLNLLLDMPRTMELGWEPLVLRPKEALALMNGTAVMTGLACLAFARADYLLHLATRITALGEYRGL